MELKRTIVVLSVMNFVLGDNTCLSTQGSTVTFSVYSKRNGTGHRLITAEIHNKNPEVMVLESHQELSMNVVHHNKKCNGSEEVSMVASIVAPNIKIQRLDYEYFLGIGYYKLHLTPKKWDEARRNCLEEDSHLAIINSKEEAEVIKSIISKAPGTIPNATYNHVFAIGYHDLEREGHYLTIFGQSLASAGYATWGDGQPNNARWGPNVDSDCGAVERNGKLNDIPCDSLTAFICEQKL